MTHRLSAGKPPWVVLSLLPDVESSSIQLGQVLSLAWCTAQTHLQRHFSFQLTLFDFLAQSAPLLPPLVFLKDPKNLT